MGPLSDSFRSSTLSLIHSQYRCDIHLSKLPLISTLSHAAVLLANRAALTQNMNNVHLKNKVSRSTHGTPPKSMAQKLTEPTPSVAWTGGGGGTNLIHTCDNRPTNVLQASYKGATDVLETC